MSKSQDGAPANFFAGVSNDDLEIDPQLLTVDQQLQVELTELFDEQAGEFLDDEMERIEFEPKSLYRLESHQIHVIRNFPLPTVYADALQKPHTAPIFNLKTNPIPRIATIFSGPSGKAAGRVCFQQFRTPQFLQKKFSLLAHGGTFHRVNHDGISLAHELAAIHENNSLFFRSLPIVSRFIDLEQYKPKATPAEIGTFLKSDLFSVPELDKVYQIIENDDFLLRRVATLQTSGLLNRIKPRSAKAKAKPFKINLELDTVDGSQRIKLPIVKKDLKQAIKFLNEEYFHGELSQDLYETNSLRKFTPS